MRNLYWLLAVLLFCSGQPALADSLSLVYEGSIQDVPYLVLPQGRFVSVGGLVLFLKNAGDVGIEARPEKGLIVITPEGKGNAEVSGFATKDLILIVGDNTLSTRGELVDGIPYIPVGIFEVALGGLGYDVIANPEAGLMSVSKPSSPDAPPMAPNAPGTLGSYPGQGFEGAINQGVSDALLSLGASQGAVSGATSPKAVGTATSAEVCQAMDDLRAAWASTEPSRQEKQSFQSLANKFQAAKDDPTLVTSSDVTELMGNLSSFKSKVDERSVNTQRWSPPGEAARVKSLGNAFLSHYLQLMVLMEDSTQKMLDGESMERGEIDALAEQIKNMESVIQGEGRRFDVEVVRVRTMNNCGPATLKKPAS